MSRKSYTPEEKARILARVAEIGAAAAAEEAGASYNSVLRWAKNSDNSTKRVATLPGEVVAQLTTEIESMEEEIQELEASLKEKKAELKSLQKAKAKAEKEKELFDAAEEKKQLLEAVLNSGKSVEEILSFLNR